VDPAIPERLVFTGSAGKIVADRWLADDERNVAVLLHGAGQTRHSWRRSGPRLASAGWTAVTFDARGHGDSDWAGDGDYSRDAHVSDLAAVVADLDVEPAIVGASMGGLTAITAVGESVVSPRAIVLVDVAPRIEPEGVRRITDFMSSAPDGFASLEEVADAVAAYNLDRPRPSNLDGLTKNLRQRAGRWYWHWDPAFLAVENAPSRDGHYDRFRAAAEKISVPTLLVRGDQSDIVSLRGVRELQQLIPHAVVHEANAGHMVAGDDNDVFATQVAEFLKDL
jgi:pimeloyl-ACP methyl ester carboxylesterase